MTEVPATASEHPATWKFDFPIYHPLDVVAWRAWLAANHDTARGVWVASWRKPSGRDRVPYEDLVEEAVCFGWIDSTVNILDDERGLQLMTPRKPKSGWTRLNRDRFAALEAQGRMTDAGRAAFAQRTEERTGVYSYERPEARFTDDETARFQAVTEAWADWQRRSPSYRRTVTHWVVSAKKPDTRARRLDDASVELVATVAPKSTIPERQSSAAGSSRRMRRT